MKNKLVCIVGETASGKDAVTNAAIKSFTDYNIRAVCSYTDRPKRDHETDGVEHYFVTTEVFNEIKASRENDLLAYTYIKNDKIPDMHGYHYMALNDELHKSHIYIIDPQGLKDLKRRYGDEIDIVTVYITAPFETRLHRAKYSRSDFNTAFDARVAAEEAQFSEFRNSNLSNYKINNLDGNFDMAVHWLHNIIKRELLKEPILNAPEPVQKTNS